MLVVMKVYEAFVGAFSRRLGTDNVNQLLTLFADNSDSICDTSWGCRWCFFSSTKFYFCWMAGICGRQKLGFIHRFLPVTYFWRYTMAGKLWTLYQVELEVPTNVTTSMTYQSEDYKIFGQRLTRPDSYTIKCMCGTVLCCIVFYHVVYCIESVQS